MAHHRPVGTDSGRRWLVGLQHALLFLVCMMSLQGNVQRGEERVGCDEPGLIMGPGDERTLGRLVDISLSGAGILPDQTGPFAGQEGSSLKVLISEVGFVPGRIARQSGELLGIKFDLGPCVERDLLIRKLFTSGLAATKVKATAWSATAALLESIIMTPTPTSPRETESGGAHAEHSRKLRAESLVIPPHAEQPRWADLADERRAVA